MTEDIKYAIMGVFDRAAPMYDTLGPRFFSYFGERLAETAAISSGSRVLKEINRILKLKGGIAVSTWGMTDTRDWNLSLAKKHLPPVADQKKIPHVLTKKYENPGEISKILSEAGFRDIKTITEEKNFYYSSKKEWWSAQYSHGIRGTLENIERTNGKEGLKRFKKDAFEMLDSLKQPEGFRQTMKVRYTRAVKF